MGMTIIHEDNHILVVNKPAGLLAQGDHTGDETLNDLAKAYLAEKFHKPGNVYLGLVHRLDRNVSGVVVLARTSKAAARLSAAFRDKEVKKTYQAVVCGIPTERQGTLKAWLGSKGDHRGVTRAEHKPFDGGRESLLTYTVLATHGEMALLEVCPITGRRHQIRAQFALVGCPLLGDVKYGAKAPLPDHRIALHALELAFKHPVGAEPVSFTVPVPADWPWPPIVSD
jgi:23S rRNA pseudouridine1911/1915/1917 synthase